MHLLFFSGYFQSPEGLPADHRECILLYNAQLILFEQTKVVAPAQLNQYLANIALNR